MLNVPAIWWHNRTQNGVMSCSWRTEHKAPWQAFTYMHFHICLQAENWAIQKVDQEYLISSEMSCWRRIENISWTNHVKNEVMYYIVEVTNILHTIKRRKVNSIGCILRRNFF
jgi:hypothetical protein